MYWKKSRYLTKFRVWKVDIGKIIIVVNNFRKTLHCRCLTGSWLYQGFEYARVLCMLLVLCKNSEYTRFLNMLKLHRDLNAWICLNNSLICLIIPQHFCRNMREYVYICMNDFYFTFPYCNPLLTWTNAWLRISTFIGK